MLRLYFVISIFDPDLEGGTIVELCDGVVVESKTYTHWCGGGGLKEGQ